MPRSKRPWTFNSSGSSRPRISPSRLLALARWSHNFSFQVVENIEFIKFCRALRGNSYNPHIDIVSAPTSCPISTRNWRRASMLKLKARTQHYRLMAGKMSRMTPLWVSLLLAMGRTGFTSWKTRWERGIPLKIWEASLVRYFPFHTRAFFFFTPPPPFTGNQESENHWVPSVLLCH